MLHPGDVTEESMTRTDLAGLALSTTSSDALAAYERGVDLFLRWRSGAMEALEAATKCDPRFALAACTRAYVAWRMGRVDLADAAAKQAVGLADGAHHERERLHVQAVDAMQRGESASAYQVLERIAAAYPTDRVAVRIVGLNYITQGDYRGGIDIARRSLAASPDEPQYQTMLGFFLEQSGYNDEGLEVSLRALAKDPTNLYTYHAVGHAYQARGDYRNALETFERAASLERYAHILWHLAESHAILGDARMTRDYWASTTPPLPLYERIELLWRLEVLRHTRTDDAIWQELAAQAERVLEHADFLTTWMHHWIGVAFARVGDWDKARQQLERLRRLPEGRASGYWSTLGAALLEAEMAIVQGDDATAVRLMTPAVEQLDTMGGGSREQKDIFRDVFLELHRRLGRVDQVIALAQQRLVANPYHLQSLAALAWAYERNGNAALQRQACRQLVRRAEEVGGAPDAPEVLAAREVLEVGV
jgi:tetratricopeptide (TPR) repeat protein